MPLFMQNCVSIRTPTEATIQTGHPGVKIAAKIYEYAWRHENNDTSEQESKMFTTTRLATADTFAVAMGFGSQAIAQTVPIDVSTPGTRPTEINATFSELND